MKITPTAIAAVAPEIVSLLPRAIPIARPATRSAPRGRLGAPSSAVPSHRPGVDQDRRGREQERDGDGVRRRRAGLARDHRAGVHRDRHSGQVRGRDAVRAADAPGGQQRHAEPAEVDQRAEDVPVEEHDARRVQQLGVLRVEPVQVEGVDEVHPPDRPGVRDPRRERPVVPERVEGEHAPAPDVLEAGGPVRGDEGGGERAPTTSGEGGSPGPAGRRVPCWRFIRGIREERTSDAEVDAQTDCERRDDQDGGNEDAEGAEQLEQDGEQRDAEHGLRQPGRWPLPPRQQAPRGDAPPPAPSGSRRRRARRPRRGSRRSSLRCCRPTQRR